MNIETIKQLNYFSNKPITVITCDINRKFNETQNIDYFTGICEKVLIDGLMTRHPITGCKNFFMFSSIVGIFEEQQLDPENPEHEFLINEIKESRQTNKEKNEFKESKQINLKNEKNELNIDSLNSLLES